MESRLIERGGREGESEEVKIGRER